MTNASFKYHLGRIARALLLVFSCLLMAVSQVIRSKISAGISKLAYTF